MSWLPAWGTEVWLRRFGWASLVGNMVLVVTGGAVRLTASGLGCPTWPRCTEQSFTPHGALSMHSAIEFGNRTLTFVLSAIAIVTFVAAIQSGRRDLFRLALLMGLAIPAQAVIGGITVLTDLNPWVVSLHLLCSLAIIGVAVLFLWRLERPGSRPGSRRGSRPGDRGGNRGGNQIGGPRSPLVVLGWTTFAAAWVVLYVGTVVTGSGPHAGDVDVERNGLDPLQLSQLHADVVFLLLGLTVALVVVTRSTAAWALLWIELAQGLVGFVQYFTDLPELLVGIHMLGAALVSAAVTWLLLDLREGPRLG